MVDSSAAGSGGRMRERRPRVVLSDACVIY